MLQKYRKEQNMISISIHEVSEVVYNSRRRICHSCPEYRENTDRCKNLDCSCTLEAIIRRTFFNCDKWNTVKEII